jgi:SOS-response transcriptional repressor LexA
MHLTPRESQVLSFIARHIDVWGYSPYQDHIAARIGVTSRTHIQRILKRLEAKGLIRIEPYKPRGISIIKQELRAAA